MCGIIGICVINPRELKLGEAIYKGLLRLEYRGYDSAGLGIINHEGLIIVKGKGKLHELEAKYGFTKLHGITGVGHTRWATHGPPTDLNAHPHTDCRSIFAVVHNGIIENYYELKKQLLVKGHVFKSDTDTEVFVHLVEDFYRETGDVYVAFKKAVKLIHGTFAILMITSIDPHKIYFAKKDSPLIVGLGNGCNIVASDIPALLDYTRKIIVVRDYWVGYVTPTEVYIEDLLSEVRVEPETYVRIVEWSIEDASREGYPHFMLKEILEQPRALSQTLSGLRSDSTIKELMRAILEADNLFITAAGTSYHASEFFAYTVMKLARRSIVPFIASEYELYENIAGENDVLIAVSQSGETIDVLKAVRAFRRKGARIIAVSNVIDSAIPRESDLSVYTRAGPEIGVAATKTFLTQTLVLSWIACELALASGSIDLSEYREIISDLEKSHVLADEAIKGSSRKILGLVDRLLPAKSMYYLSRDIGLPIAREGALKVKEIAYVHAEAYPAGESKHGPIALVEQGFPVVFIVPPDSGIEQKILGNIEEMKARGAFTIGVVHEGSSLNNVVEFPLEVPRAHWITTPITHTPPLQLLAYHLAVKKGHDPDKPRNLAKTVTVE
ncbi:MAG: glutamine--fructose-6-phosphate transaminase (isomerizing) [Desulfurococcaceae archaeon]